MSPVHNERTKLLANALDRASTTVVTVGIATPAVGYLYNLGGLRDAVPGWLLAAGVLSCFLIALGLHLLARRILGRLL